MKKWVNQYTTAGKKIYKKILHIKLYVKKRKKIVSKISKYPLILHLRSCIWGAGREEFSLPASKNIF